MRKVRLQGPKHTNPKLVVAGNRALPLVTWNSGNIEQVSTRRMRARRREVWREVLIWALLGLCVVIIVGSVLFGLWWLRGYAML